ncbi:MAG: hypothetical protein LBV07_06205 [Syntrophobacterales bacterium]|nr:hypothetical protein [Syntrophobacterales bacterium]
MCIAAGLILFTGWGTVNGEKLSFQTPGRFFSPDPIFQADVMALEKKQKASLPLEINYGPGIIYVPDDSIIEGAAEDRWNEIRLPGLTLSLSRHVKDKEHSRHRINQTPENPHGWDAMLPVLLRGAHQTGDIEALGGFLSPHFNLKIEF